MSQEQRNDKTPSEEPTALTQRESDDVSVLSSIDKHIIQANDPQDISLLIQARGEVIRQDEEVQDRKQHRFLEKVEMGFKVGFPVICFIAGIVGMIIGGLEAGPYISGLGLSGLGIFSARKFFRGSRKKDKGEKNAEE